MNNNYTFGFLEGFRPQLLKVRNVKFQIKNVSYLCITSQQGKQHYLTYPGGGDVPVARPGLYRKGLKVVKEMVSNLPIDAEVFIGGRHLHVKHRIESTR